MSAELLDELRQMNEEKGKIIAEIEAIDQKWGLPGHVDGEMRKKADEAAEDADRYDQLEESNAELSDAMEDVMDALPDDVDASDVTTNL
jgi:hypothetical protein